MARWVLSILLILSAPGLGQRGRPIPRYEPPRLPDRRPEGKEADPFRMRDFRDIPKKDQDRITRSVQLDLLKTAQKEAYGKATSRVNSLLHDVRRTDWSFIQLYEWDPNILTIDPLAFERPIGRPSWPAVDPAEELQKGPLKPQKPLVVLKRQEIEDLRRNSLDYFLKKNAGLISIDPLTGPYKRAVVYTSGTQTAGVDVGTLSALNQARGAARFTIVRGAKSLSDVKPLAGHLVIVPGDVSGQAMDRVLDTLDRFMSSFSDPKNWSQDPPASERALLLVRWKREEIVINVDLLASSAQGRIICSLFRTAGTTDPERQEFLGRVTSFLKQYREQRIYVAGDTLTALNLDEIARAEDIELVHRNLSHHRTMMATDRRLKDLHLRRLNPGKLTFINGLPSTPEAVEALGPFAGGTEPWMRFRDEVDTAAARIASAPLSTKEAVLDALSYGQGDLLILVAHANGTAVYLNGQAISFAELEALPPRRKGTERARLAILLTCHAGAEMTEVTGWRRWIYSQKQTASLADILVRKNFADRVIAPKHAIRPEETLAILRAVLSGSPITAKHFRKGWLNWANVWRTPGHQG